jgi:hypothetical protein
MKGWRFYPLEGFKHQGLLVGRSGPPRPAEFLTPEQAKALVQRKAA